MRIEFGAVLFDCDGVLVDSLDAAAKAWDNWSARYAPEFDFRTQIQHGVRAEDTVATLVEPELLDEAVRALADEEERLATDTPPIVGAVDLTSTLPEGRWAVVTSGVSRLAHARLAAAGIRRPRVLVTADDVTEGKPSPEPYALGAELLGTEPGRCVVIEDAPAGVRAARAAGAGHVIGVGGQLDGADVSVLDLTHLRYDGDALVVG